MYNYKKNNITLYKPKICYKYSFIIQTYISKIKEKTTLSIALTPNITKTIKQEQKLNTKKAEVLNKSYC